MLREVALIVDDVTKGTKVAFRYPALPHVADKDDVIGFAPTLFSPKVLAPPPPRPSPLCLAPRCE